jgi:DNA-binding MarR family transcriptional regulator
MKFNPDVQIAELAEMTGVSRIAIQKTVKLLADKGYIMRDVGKYARWHVCITNAKD